MGVPAREPLDLGTGDKLTERCLMHEAVSRGAAFFYGNTVDIHKSPTNRSRLKFRGSGVPKFQKGEVLCYKYLYGYF